MPTQLMERPRPGVQFKHYPDPPADRLGTWQEGMGGRGSWQTERPMFVPAKVDSFFAHSPLAAAVVVVGVVVVAMSSIPLRGGAGRPRPRRQMQTGWSFHEWACPSKINIPRPSLRPSVRPPIRLLARPPPTLTTLVGWNSGHAQ